MQLRDRRILLTGATGGIGRALAERLVDAGARVAVAGRSSARVAELARALDPKGQRAVGVTADLAEPEGPERTLSQAREALGEVDILVNNAAVLDFVRFADSAPESLETIVRANLLAPMRLTRAALPTMIAAGTGAIVNIGSAFGAIGFPYFTAYSATKFGLRGFSEALRRELVDTGVHVLYAAPRATRTRLNSAGVYRMGEQTGMHFDRPEWVADAIVRALDRDRKEAHFGWPERFFVRLNALLPGLVDKALRKQGSVMGKYVE
jgi:short-subunit dehydrogenase